MWKKLKTKVKLYNYFYYLHHKHTTAVTIVLKCMVYCARLPFGVYPVFSSMPISPHFEEFPVVGQKQCTVILVLFCTLPNTPTTECSDRAEKL